MIERHALHVVFVVDASGSMSGERMGSLNWAAKATVPAMREVAFEHPAVDVLVRVCRFSDAVDWPVTVPTPVDRFVWANLVAGGETCMGAALEAVAAALVELEAAGGRNLPPVIVLLSDGLPSDDARAGIAALDATELGRQAIRIPIAIGSDADLEILQAFTGCVDTPAFAGPQCRDVGPAHAMGCDHAVARPWRRRRDRTVRHIRGRIGSATRERPGGWPRMVILS